MRETGYYWVRWGRGDAYEIAKWSLATVSWARAGACGLFSNDPVEILGRVYLPTVAQPPAPAPVTLEDVARVLWAERLNDSGLVPALYFDPCGTVRLSNVKNGTIQYASIEAMQCAFRAAIEEIDRPRKAIDEILRGTK